MPHIHEEPGDHDPTASAYIVRLDTPKPTLMLHKHRKLGGWLQFGGHVELKENPWQGVVHEIREESGYDIDQLSVLQPPVRIKQLTGVVLLPVPFAPMAHKFPGLDHYHYDWGIGFLATEPPRHQPEDGESTDNKCFTAADLLAIPDSEIPTNVREAGLFILQGGLEHWERVPATEWSLDTPSPHFE